MVKNMISRLKSGGDCILSSATVKPCPIQKLPIFEIELVLQFSSYHVVIRKIVRKSVSLRPKEMTDLKTFILVFLGSCAVASFGNFSHLSA